MRTRLIALASWLCVLCTPAVASAQLKVIISGGFSAAYRELIPQFESANSVKVTTTTGGSVGTGPNTIGAQLRRGEKADVVILAREGLGELITEKRIVPGTDVDLGRSLIGMVVREGAPKPDISTPEKLKQVLIAAKSVAVSSSTSGVYLTTTLFPKLGIGEQMRAKTSMNGAVLVGRGEAEVGLQQVSEVLPIEHTTFVGRIPEEIQYVTIYAAAVVAGSSNIATAKKLVAYLSSPGAAAAIQKSGMEPINVH